MQKQIELKSGLATSIVGPILAFTKYFCIAKENGSGRVIFSGKELSRLFYRPPGSIFPLCRPCYA